MKKNLPGFTLIETLVAITILLTAIVGPFYAIQKSIVAAYVGRDQLTAAALSQEAVEYIYGLRDTNYLQNQQEGGSYSWLDGINGNMNAGGDYANCVIAGNPSGINNPNGCTLDPTQVPAFVACSSNTCMPLTLNANAVRYTQQPTNPATRFTRKITVSVISPVEARVQVTVSWSTLGNPYSIVTTEDLYNWQ